MSRPKLSNSEGSSSCSTESKPLARRTDKERGRKKAREAQGDRERYEGRSSTRSLGLRVGAFYFSILHPRSTRRSHVSGDSSGIKSPRALQLDNPREETWRASTTAVSAALALPSLAIGKSTTRGKTVKSENRQSNGYARRDLPYRERNAKLLCKIIVLSCNKNNESY